MLKLLAVLLIVQVQATLVWRHCGDGTDILHIDSIQVLPQNPTWGETLKVHIRGSLSSEVSYGSNTNVSVKYGPIYMPEPKYDLCLTDGQRGA